MNQNKEQPDQDIENLKKLADKMNQQIFQFLLEQGYSNPKILNNGRIACVAKFIFTHAIIVVQPESIDYIDDRWCYDTEEKAIQALNEWSGSGEPNYWKRHPFTGRRRDDGDPLKEYINP